MNYDELWNNIKGMYPNKGIITTYNQAIDDFVEYVQNNDKPIQELAEELKKQFIKS